MSEDPSEPSTETDPGYKQVYDFLMFGMSLPERTLRSASGVVAGTLRESASLLVPQAEAQRLWQDIHETATSQGSIHWLSPVR